MKKKLFACFMAVVILVSCSTAALAVEPTVPVGKLSATAERSEEIIPRATQTLTFNNLYVGQSVFSADNYNINDEDTILEIISATWGYASCSIWVGYYNIQTGHDYGVEYYGGNIVSKSISSEGVPNGTYRIMVKNLGPMVISGAMQYNVI